ncbi:17675_t:CDS:2, partial [Cetraspora pellucida]
ELPKKIDVVENKEKEKKELNKKEKLPETKPPKKIFRPKNLSVEDKEIFSLKFFENNKAAKEYIKANLKEGFFTIKGEYELEKDRDNDW